LAVALEEFERKKLTIDWDVNQDRPMISVGGRSPEEWLVLVENHPRKLEEDERVLVPAGKVQEIFKAVFSDGQKVWRGEIRRQINIRKPFVALFCGGSFAAPYLMKLVTSDMDKYKKEATKKGTKFEYEFLENLDRQRFVKDSPSQLMLY
jgi:hypothetical protein